ncbi:P63C domain-containing protein [Zobellia galactanivorans]|uniref:P63C domain-containing protein n=1 Tax=Zobellia galactanivorans (strain DSM 12802 / CCUG 47099 / CIP 106680 / NCIMB 13871 / Dsij) TaxID=63186 RepID=UPI0026E468F1|nr:P63C domain-containing protein [Zobellia galactanivorans]MDO6810029.1 P63C domain-containing protein [Zobellia galactanivorans]
MARLKATHEGALKIGDATLEVAVLNNGQRIITQSAVFKALKRPVRGNPRLIGIPVFMDAKNLQPFVNKELEAVIGKVEYFDKNGKKQEGYDANILPLVSDLYLRAREAGVIIQPNQAATAQRAEILVRSLAKIGITALVDEATGYQYDRERQELQKILKQYISEELLPWQKTFPDEFYIQIFRLNGWEYNSEMIKKRPGVVGHWTNQLIYDQLPTDVLKILKQKTPKSESGNYTARFFQSLTPDIGNAHLQNQLVSVVTLMKISKNWSDFMEKFNQLYGQTQIDFPDERKDELSNFNKNLKKGLDWNPNE